jgi:hypothetical protein
MAGLSQRARERMFAAGVVCLVYGTGMLAIHWWRSQRPQPPPTATYSAAPAAVQRPPESVPPWVHIRKHKAKGPVHSSAVAAQKAFPSSAPVVSSPTLKEEPAAPPKPQWFRVQSGNIMRLAGNIALVPTGISFGTSSTRISLVADGSESQGGRVCKFFVSGIDNNGDWVFLIDNDGRRYRLLEDPNQYPGSNCIEIAAGERVALQYVFEPVPEQDQGVTLYWKGDDISSVLISLQKTSLSWEGVPTEQAAPVLADPQAERLSIASAGEAFLHGSGVGLSVESVEVNRLGTKVFFRATGPTARFRQFCPLHQGVDSGAKKQFLIDDAGRRYDFLIDTRGRTCKALVEGEVTRFAVIYEPLRLPVSGFSVHYYDGGRTDATIRVEVRQ